MRTLMAAIVVAVLVVATHAWAKSAPGGAGWYPGIGYVTANGDATVDPSASTTSLEAEFCPTTVASNALPAASILAGAKSLYVENRSSATCYASFDAAAATSTGNRGFKWAAGTERAIDVSGTTFGSRIRIACTAALTSNACLWLQWFE